MVRITLPDGSHREVKSGSTVMQLAESIGPRLAQAALVAKIDGELKDLATSLDHDSHVKILTFEDDDGKQVFWHSGAHLMAQAILRLFPQARLTIGPPTENGFYYDIAHQPFSENDLERIQEEMKKIVAENLDIHKLVYAQDEAKDKFRHNKYKLEIIDEDIKEGVDLTAYEQGEFIDLCRGPHVPSTGYLKAFELTKTSGAYWRGDAKNDQLQRVYGISFPSAKDLKKYNSLMAEAEKRDHRKIGPDLGLFTFSDLSPGSAFFLPKGAIIYNELLSFMRNEYKNRGYQEVITPLVYEKSLWEQSGHWEHYRDNMFQLEIEGKSYSLKPMNCPSHILIYKMDHRSYRDLPLRIADFAPLHRNELSGTLTGLTRVRKMAQDDAHIFITPGQIESEVMALIDFVDYIYSQVFHFDYAIELSTMPEKALGDPKLWVSAEKSLQSALERKKLTFNINPGDGAFYGPKIDFHIKDSIGRSWQCGTIQLDFNLPKRFNAVYEGADGKRHETIIIHRALLGSLERFIGVLTEHYAGKFPLWISPIQVRILSVSDKFKAYADDVLSKLHKSGLRAEFDDRAESISYKVRAAQLDQINYILVVGEKEVKNKTITIRTRDNIVVGEVTVPKFTDRLLKEIEEKQ